MDAPPDTAHTAAPAPFTAAPARARRKRKGRPPPAAPSPAELFERTAADLRASAWLREATQLVQDALPALPAARGLRALCLGLGSPAASPDARAQLAFLVALCDALSIPRASVALFDPVFTRADEQLLDALRLARLPENKRAAHALPGPCVVFMPHCDVRLYEGLLRANWAPAPLARLLLIANRLSAYAESTPARRLAAEHPCVARLAPRLATRALPACPAFPTAFSSTAVQVVAAALPAPAEDPEQFWVLPPLAPDRSECDVL